MHCTSDVIPENKFGLTEICMDGAEVTLQFNDGTSTTSVFEEEFLAKEAVRGEQQHGTYERFNAPLTPEMQDRGIADLRIEENAAEEITLIIVEAVERQDSVTIKLQAAPPLD